MKHTDDTSGIFRSLLPDQPGSLEAQVVAYSDKIAYICHDLEDAISAGIVEELEKNNIIPKGYLGKFWLDFGIEQHQISKGVSPLIAGMIRILIEETSKVINKYGVDSIEKVRGFTLNPTGKNKIVNFGPYESKFIELKKFVYQYIYSSPVVSIMDVKAVRIVKNILHTYRKNPEQLPYPVYNEYIKAKEAPEQSADGYRNTPARVICDYIAFMTDRYAIEEYDRLFAPHSKIYRGTGI